MTANRRARTRAGGCRVDSYRPTNNTGGGSSSSALVKLSDNDSGASPGIAGHGSNGGALADAGRVPRSAFKCDTAAASAAPRPAMATAGRCSAISCARRSTSGLGSMDSTRALSSAKPSASSPPLQLVKTVSDQDVSDAECHLEIFAGTSGNPLVRVRRGQ